MINNLQKQINMIRYALILLFVLQIVTMININRCNNRNITIQQRVPSVQLEIIDDEGLC